MQGELELYLYSHILFSFAKILIFPYSIQFSDTMFLFFYGLKSRSQLPQHLLCRQFLVPNGLKIIQLDTNPTTIGVVGLYN